MSDKCIRSVPAAAIAGYQDLSDFERGVIIGAREMGHSISEVAMKFGFSRTTISRVYREYRVSAKKLQNFLRKHPNLLVLEQRGTGLRGFHEDNMNKDIFFLVPYSEEADVKRNIFSESSQRKALLFQNIENVFTETRKNMTLET
ncbi:hypothetical protein AVEN_241223-1 [Araneus ventricosus]|uniref:Tc3 transposase DNA binding domain-containing protein n=1 Tax=Araneus ventricosus TaxID=182803 RepID=A0A4Y2CZN9_ARAVE|nr:hypothetical protein AVEN_241223-1 [Araneus ventricosus]